MEGMTRHRLPGLLLSMTLGTVGLVFAASTSAFGQAASAPPADETDESLDVRYARASLRLAEMDLQKAVDANKRFGRTLPPYAIEPLRAVVKIAEKQLQHVLHKDAETLHQVHLAIAEAKVTTAEAELERALAVNKQSSGLFSDTEIERLRQAAEVARLGLAKARAVNIQSHAEHLQWQVEELQKEVLQLQSRVALLSLRK